MTDWLEFWRWAHVLGACVLVGTGVGIAFFMLMAHRSGDAHTIAVTGRMVIVADYLFTATAVIAQPVSGYLLARMIGWDYSEGWLRLSLALFIGIGFCWLPVLVIQHRMTALARRADIENAALPPAYYRLFRIWFVLGIPAFTGVLTILWLMVNRPSF